MTHSGWTQIMFFIADSYSVFTIPFFILFVFIGSFFLINLTLAVVKLKFSEQ